MGIRVGFPKDTEPKKSYKWRFLKTFLDKVEEFEMSDEIARRLLDEIANYAVANNLTRKGLALLASDSVLEICCKRISESNQKTDELVEKLKHDCQLVRDVELLSKPDGTSWPTIVRLYIHGDLSESCLALSERCHQAMMKLDKLERQMLPSGKSLILRQNEIASKISKSRLRAIMGGDLRRLLC